MWLHSNHQGRPGIFSSDEQNELLHQSRWQESVLGLCAIVLSSPYDIPIHIPRALMLLCEHSHDPNLIRKSIKNALSEFRRTHHDSWHEHREKFTEDQLVILADVLISPNYYA
ncbi:unnamed protein product [Rotaria sp. Silwood1]|nr:unnamed protein product [Rotaria sp. Silwood1]